jgi:glycosyltransferase involved in cell wall biosynthesis
MPDLPRLPPVASEPLTAALLAHNDAAHVQELVASWARHLDGMGRDYQLILVDDGSGDGTVAKAEALRETFPRLEVLRHEAPRGVGAALRTAVAAARQPLFFYTLCDPRYRPDDMPRLFMTGDQTIDQVHLVTGYRAGRPVPAAWRVLGGLARLLCRVVFSAAPDPLPGWLGVKGHAARLLARVLFGVRNRDVLCPYRLLRREILARIPIQSDGPFAHVEVLAKANFLGCVMAEDAPLGEAGRPVVPAPRDGPGENFLKECWRVFDRPNFGPTVLPSEGKPPVEARQGIKA